MNSREFKGLESNKMKPTKNPKVQEDNTGVHFKRTIWVGGAFGNVVVSHKSWRKWLTGLTILADITGYQWDVSKNLLGTTGKDFPSWWDHKSRRWEKKNVLSSSSAFPIGLWEDVRFGGIVEASYLTRGDPASAVWVDGKSERCT